MFCHVISGEQTVFFYLLDAGNAGRGQTLESNRRTAVLGSIRDTKWHVAIRPKDLLSGEQLMVALVRVVDYFFRMNLLRLAAGGTPATQCVPAFTPTYTRESVPAQIVSWTARSECTRRLPGIREHIPIGRCRANRGKAT